MCLVLNTGSLEHRDCTSHPVVQAWFGNPEMVNLLLQAGADPELRNCLGRSYLEALTLGGSGPMAVD
jgi:ankyrin repeat protein